MKKMVTDIMLMPTYVSRFTCIGGDCEDTCCAGWGVTIDKDSFFRYQSCFDPVLRPLFTRHVKPYAKSKSSQDYGHIELRKDECRNCGLLSDKKLCLIQERLGEQALSDTCAYYPRTIFRFGDLHQMTLTLSCPEAARLALLDEDAFGFVGEAQTASRDFIHAVKPKLGLSLDVMAEVQTLMFQILRSRDTPLANRLKIIGLFIGRLTGLLQAGSVTAVPDLLQELERDLGSGAALAPFLGTTELPDVQAQIAATLFLVGDKSFQSPYVQKILDEAAKGLGFRNGTAPDQADLLEAYELGRNRLAPALEAVPWLLEHFMLNEILRTTFPWGLENPKQQYAALVLRFATVRLLLVGRAAAREAPLEPKELAETVQVTCRRFVHDQNYTRNANHFLADIGRDSLERLFALL